MKVLLAQSGEKILVSDRDFPLLRKFNWFLDTNGYPYTRAVITKFILDPRRDRVRDHRNDDKLDNRRRNLQLITQAQNIQKARPSKAASKSSRFRGVSWHKAMKQWRATLSFRKRGQKKKQISLGYYDSEQAAAKAYNRGAQKRWGRFAWRNEV